MSGNRNGLEMNPDSPSVQAHFGIGKYWQRDLFHRQHFLTQHVHDLYDDFGSSMRQRKSIFALDELGFLLLQTALGDVEHLAVVIIIQQDTVYLRPKRLFFQYNASIEGTLLHNDLCLPPTTAVLR